MPPRHLENPTIEQIVKELTDHHRRTGEYTVTDPLIFNEVKLVAKFVFTKSATQFTHHSLTEDDLVQEACIHLMKPNSQGLKGYLLYKAYIEPQAVGGLAGPPTLKSSRALLRTYIARASQRHWQRSAISNIVTRAKQLLKSSPYVTTGEGTARRYWLEDSASPADHFAPEPSQQALDLARRQAQGIPKIPQAPNAERTSIIWHEKDLDHVLHTVLNHAPGLTNEQLWKIFDELLTEYGQRAPITGVTSDSIHSDSKLALDQPVAVVLLAAKEIWLATDEATKLILARSHAGMTDLQIAQQTAFDMTDPMKRMSRAWVTTKQNELAKLINDQCEGYSMDDVERVLTELRNFTLLYEAKRNQ
jgi:hypothetical protein